MSPNSQGLAPTFQEAANVTTNFDVLYQTAPFTIPNGGGNSLSISIGAAITKTAPGTTTFSISQPELILVPVRTA
jgi:hypothetical protein